MDLELRKFWKLFTLHPTKTLFLEMFLPWFLVESEWVKILVKASSFFIWYANGVFSERSLLLLHSGTPALTSRGFVEEDFAKVAEYFDKAVNVALKVKSEAQGFSFL